MRVGWHRAHTVLSHDLTNYRRTTSMSHFWAFCPVTGYVLTGWWCQTKWYGSSLIVCVYMLVYKYIDTRHVYESESMFIQSLKINFQPLLFSVAFCLCSFLRSFGRGLPLHKSLQTLGCVGPSNHAAMELSSFTNCFRQWLCTLISWHILILLFLNVLQADRASNKSIDRFLEILAVTWRQDSGVKWLNGLMVKVVFLLNKI